MSLGFPGNQIEFRQVDQSLARRMRRLRGQRVEMIGMCGDIVGNVQGVFSDHVVLVDDDMVRHHVPFGQICSVREF